MIRENIEVKMNDARLRKVRILLPEDYKQSNEKYPVLYMFDGQNVFDEEDSFGGVTWGVQESVEKLVKEKKIRPLIIVAIDNAGEKRLDEYGPWAFSDDTYSSEGKGKEFAAFFVETFIPIMEEKYPISTDKRSRYLAGSSMGALITAYIGTKYPELFSSLGLFSLASWVSEKEFLKMIHKEGNFSETRFFIQVGTEESRGEKSGKVEIESSQKYVDNTLRFIRAVILRGADAHQMSVNIAVGKTHNEEAWASFMPQFLTWLAGS
ncbi:MAG TPA: alpha/beta hydrolase-fold protein [Proteiniclasticum sp.]|nr:alpha/beta hydrolase-fold protein [Proteiniclasticum sp.]